MQHKQSGFTLIELMIVVAIIGILASIAMVSFQGYYSKTQDKAAQSDARNLVSSMVLYSTVDQ